jgi:hypothetical protein
MPYGHAAMTHCHTLSARPSFIIVNASAPASFGAIAGCSAMLRYRAVFELSLSCIRNSSLGNYVGANALKDANAVADMS